MKTVSKKALVNQIKATKENLKPEAFVVDGLIAMTDLMHMFFKYLESKIDKEINEKNT